MPEQEVRAISEIVEFCQCCRQVIALEYQRLIDIRTYRGEGMNAVVLLADFKVERKAARRKAWVHSDMWKAVDVPYLRGLRQIKGTLKSQPMKSHDAPR